MAIAFVKLSVNHRREETLITSRAFDRQLPVKAALVVATGRDRTTAQLLSAAREAAGMLETAGYQVFPHYQAEATCAGVYVKLRELKQEGIGVVVGFMAAHGSERGLHDRYGEILIDATVCEQMVGSILVLASCLLDGTFPRRCAGMKNSVAACIGFRGKLWAPRPKWWSTLLAPYSSRKVLDDFRKCILQPLCCLLRNRSVSDSTKESKSMWRKKASSLRSRDLRVALVFEANCVNLDFWGKGTSKL